MNKVYLGHLDINSNGVLELQKNGAPASNNDVLEYIFSYGLISDEVLMQGSAPLKSKEVFNAYQRLTDAFVRNEYHLPKPIFSFILSGDIEDYTAYLDDRFNFLKDKGDDNAEKLAYLRNDAEYAVKIIDADLCLIDVPRRKYSVSKAYKKGLINSLKSGNFSQHGITDESARNTINIISNEETIQTFSLIDNLQDLQKKQLLNVYKLARQKYRQANAYGSQSMDSDSDHIYQWHNVNNFLFLIGVSKIFKYNEILSSDLLFKIKLLDSFVGIRKFYFDCQNQNDITTLFRLIHDFNHYGQFRTALQHGAGAFFAVFFEFLRSKNIGFNTINMGLESVAKKIVITDYDEVWAQKYYTLCNLLVQLEKEMAFLTKINMCNN